MSDFARILIIIGLVIAFSGLVILIATRYFPWLGNLPGDIRIERENFRLYFPLATMILISVLGTILLNIVIRIFRD
jgi:magnesium-transporting ATPase (P-type)